MAFFHKVPDHVKAVAERLHMELVLSNGCRHSRITPFEEKHSNCHEQHRDPILSRQEGVAYEVSTPSGHVCIWEAGRYFNE